MDLHLFLSLLCHGVNSVDEILLFSSKSRIKVLNILMNELPGAWRRRTWSGFSLEAFLNRKSGRELDLSLCAFNYTRLAGLQSPESRGKARVRTSHSDGSSVLPYLNTLEGGRGGGTVRVRGGRITGTTEGSTGLIQQTHLQEPQAAVDHSSVFWLICSENNCRARYRLPANHSRQAHIEYSIKPHI